jgi:hypothetical protein
MSSVARTLLRASRELDELVAPSAGKTVSEAGKVTISNPTYIPGRRIKPERFSKPGGNPLETTPSNLHYDPTNQRTQQNLVNQNQQLRATARAERATARVEQNQNKIRQQGNVLSYDESIPLTRGTEDTQGALRHQIEGNRNLNLNARGTVTPADLAPKIATVDMLNQAAVRDPRINANFAEGTIKREAPVVSEHSSGKVFRDRGATQDEVKALYNQEASRMGLNEVPAGNLGISPENAAALGGANQRILEAQETGSVVGLVRRQNELYNQGRVRGSIDGAVPQAGTAEGLEYGLLGNQIDIMERNASKSDLFSANPEAQQASKRLFSGDAYDEAVNMRNNQNASIGASDGYDEVATNAGNNAVANEAMRGGTNGSGYSGLYQPSQGNTQSSVGVFNMMEADGMAGIAGSVGFGALLGGTANYAMGGEFGEGAMMGGLAGGAMKIGARAIQANEAGIENYLQRTALGEGMESMNRTEAGQAIREMQQAPEGLMPGMAFNVLKSGAPSVGMQSRYAVMGGSMLSGVAFTGRRNDKRRGFNAHRGNRI